MAEHLQPHPGQIFRVLSPDPSRRQTEVGYLRRLLEQIGPSWTESERNALLSDDASARAIELELIDRFVSFIRQADGDPGMILDFLESDEAQEFALQDDQPAELTEPRRFAEVLASRQTSQKDG